MKPRKPRPPVNEQGMWHGYREEMLDGNVQQVAAPRSRFEWWAVWAATAGGCALSMTLAVVDSGQNSHANTGILLFWIVSLLNRVYLQRWSRRRPVPGPGMKALAIVSSALAVAWLVALVVDDLVVHVTNSTDEAALALTGFVLFFGALIVLYATRNYRWRRDGVTPEQSPAPPAP